MADERTRWTDERLDDSFGELRDDLAEIKAGVKQMQADELKQLRDRAERAERSVQQAGAARQKDARAGRIRVVGYALAVFVPIFCCALGAFLGALFSHVL